MFFRSDPFTSHRARNGCESARRRTLGGSGCFPFLQERLLTRAAQLVLWSATIAMPSFTTQRHILRTSDPAQILPLKLSDTRPTTTSRLRKRCCRLLVVLFLSFWALFWLYNHQPGEDSPASEENTTNHSLPPLYEAYHDYERHLPQHNLSLPFPEGRDAKFFWVPNHVTGEHCFCLCMTTGVIFFRSLGVGQRYAGAPPQRSPCA